MQSRRLQCLAVCCTAALGCVPIASASAATTARKAASAHLGDRPLRLGTKGNDVKELQRLLTKLGFKVTADGNYGTATAQAVQHFQTVARIQASGSVGPKTVAAMRKAASGGDPALYASGGYSTTKASAKSLGDRIPVMPGMSGHDIRVLQDFLNRAGFKIKVDGEFGPSTTTQVKRFEKANELPADSTVDGTDIEVLKGQAGAGTDAASAPLPLQLAPGDRAKIASNGQAMAPATAPDSVKAIISAGNQIASTPYKWGGGHGKWTDSGYDCSGSVSFALHGAGLLDSPLVSGDFPKWGQAGAGQWVTIYGNSGHVYMVVAGIRFDTSGASPSRWQPDMRPTKGYRASHPIGL